MVPADPASRRKRLLVADMESTIIEQECLDEIADYRRARRAQIADITARAMRGELDFAAALKERVGLLRGLDADVLERVYERVTLMPGAATLIATMRRRRRLPARWCRAASRSSPSASPRGWASTAAGQHAR